MQLEVASQMAQALMEQYGVTDKGWTFSFDNGKVRAACAHFGAKRITLSRHLTKLWSEKDIENSLRHEIAHVLVGYQVGHGPEWKRMAIQVGADPNRCYDAEELPAVDAPWVGTCPSCGKTMKRHQQPVRVTSCGDCGGRFNSQYIFGDWTYYGRPTNPSHPKYVAELRRVQGQVSSQSEMSRKLHLEAARAKNLERPRQQSRVVIGGTGRFAGLTGVVEKVGRSRYHVRLDTSARNSTFSGQLVAAPFDLVTVKV